MIGVMRRVALVVAAGAVAVAAPAAGTVTLAQVVKAVREGNPEIASQRAQVAADTAQVAIVRAPARPRIQASGNFTDGTNGANVSSGFDRTFDANLFATLPVYDGGAVHSGVAQQRARLAGSGADAAATENRVVADAITAYLDILRDREVVTLNDENLALLDRDLGANRERLREGDVTRTDLAQTESRRAQAIARLAEARTRLAASEEDYRRVVGVEADALAPPPPLPRLPNDSAVTGDLALSHDPRVAAGRANEAAAHAAIRVARAAARPTLNLTGGAEYHNYGRSPVGYPDQRGGGAEVTGALAYPIYQGGLVRAQIAQARADANKASFDREATARTATADARSAMVRYAASLRTIAEIERAVAFERDALAGTQIEAKGGERLVLDVLNAELELLDTQVGLVNARHDSYLAGVAVMTSLDLLGCFDRPTAACMLRGHDGPVVCCPAQ